MLRLSCFILLMSQVALAQHDSWIKSANGETGSFTDAKCIVLHPAGDVFSVIAITGKNTIEGQAIDAGGIIAEDSFISRYKSSGEIIWIKRLFTSTEGYGINRVTAIEVDGNGDLLVVGASYTMASFLGASAGLGAFIAKFDADLNLKWINYESQVSLQDFRSFSAVGERIVIDKDNNVIWYTDQIYSQNFAEYGGLALIKYSSSGARLWNKLITFNPEFFHPVLRGITMERNGTITVSGVFFERIHFSGISFFNNQSVNVNRQQLFVARFSPAGDYLWAIQSNYGASTVGLSHTSDIDGNIYLSGQFFGAGSQLITNGNTYIHENDLQGFVAKIDNSGKLIWLNTIDRAYAWDITLGRDGFLYLTGIVYGEFQYQSFKMPSEGTNTFIIKIDDGGFYRGSSFSRVIDNPDTPESPDAYGFQTITDANGNLYTQGAFREGIIFGCVSASTEIYYYSFYLIKHRLNQTPSAQSLTITGPAGPFCESTVITLQTNSFSEIKKYKWFLPEGVTSTNGQTELTDNFITVSISPLASNKPIIVIGETDSVCNVFYGDPYTVEILVKPQAPKIILSKNQVCPVTSEFFAVKRPETNVDITWSLPAGVTAQLNAAADTAKLNFLTSFSQGEITVTATNTCGSANTTFPIQTFLNPHKPVLTGDLVLCAADIQIEKSATPVANALVYEWELPPFISHNPSLPNTSVDLHAFVFPQFFSGQIRVRAIGNCSPGEWSNPISISRVAPPGNITSIAGPDQICVDTDGVVTYQVSALANATSYIWTVPDVFLTKGKIITGTNQLELRANLAGDGMIKVYAINTCNEKGDSVMLPVSTFKKLAQPMLEATICDRELIVSNAASPQWYYEGNLLSNVAQTSIVVLDSGIYYVSVNNFCGTQQSEYVQVYPVIPEKLFFPNVITPDGDGMNDFFKIDKSLTNTSLLILNRWGKEIYYTSDYQNDWMADDHPTGVYFYKMSNSCVDMPIQGWINVVR
jgi:hypothetical protein